MKENAYKLLDDLDVEYKRINHPPLFTCNDAEKYNIDFLGCLKCKNLFLQNKDKSKLYLLSMPLFVRADLKALQKTLNESRLSFANEDILFEKLMVRQGAASLLNVANVKNTDVVFLVDKLAMQSKTVGFHPSDNTETLVFASNEIPHILDSKKIEWRFI